MERPGTGSVMRVVRIVGVLEPGGAQLSALRLSRALAGFGIDSSLLLAGDATGAGRGAGRAGLGGGRGWRRGGAAWRGGTGPAWRWQAPPPRRVSVSHIVARQPVAADEKEGRRSHLLGNGPRGQGPSLRLARA